MTDATATTSESFSVKLTPAERKQLNELAAAHGRMSAGAYLRLLIAQEHAALLQGQRGIPATAQRKPTPADLHALVMATGPQPSWKKNTEPPASEEPGLAYEPLDAA